MEEALIVGIVFFSIVTVIKIIADAATMRKLIEKGGSDLNIKPILGTFGFNTLANLKWGMVLIAVGIAALIGQFLPYRWSDEGTFGLMLICAGAAFLIYFPIAQKRLKELERRQDQSTS